MKAYKKLKVFWIALMLLFPTIGITKENPVFVEVEVKGVNIDPIGQSPIVILVDKERKRALPIWIGIPEAHAIDRELRGERSERPMTHDLFQSVLSHLQVKVKDVKIVDLRENTYYAVLSLIHQGKVAEMDARPSDSIVMALKSKAPVFVSLKVLEKQGILLEQKDILVERRGIRVQELTRALASQFNYKGDKGILVAEVLAGSLAEAVGVRSGDIITRIDSKEVGSIQEFREIFDTAAKGTQVKLSIFRDGKYLDLTLPKER